jgi:tetratricopeptide (TPR) repeat protein
MKKSHISQNFMSIFLFFCTFFLFLTHTTGEEFFRKGREQYQMGRYVDAIKSFRTAIEKKENMGESYYYVAQILYGGGKYEQAASMFIKSFENGGTHPNLIEDSLACFSKLNRDKYIDLLAQKKIYIIPVAYQMINQERQKNEWETVLKIYEDASKHPYFQFQQGRFKTELAFIYLMAAKAVLKTSKERPKAMELANLSIQADNSIQEARDIYNRMRDEIQSDFDNAIQSALMHFRANHFAEATEFYKKALEIKPGSQEATNGIEECKLAIFSYKAYEEGKKLYEQKKMKDAINKLNLAATYEKNYSAKSLLNQIKQEIVRESELKQYKKDNEVERNSRFIQFINKADNYLESGTIESLEEAIRILKAALEIKSDAETNSKLRDAKSLLSQKERMLKAQKFMAANSYDKALEILKPLEKENSSLSGLSKLLISAFFGNQEYQDVITRGEEFLAMFPRSFEVMFQVAVAYEQLRDNKPEYAEKALEYFKLLQREHPDDTRLDPHIELMQREKYSIFVPIGLALFGLIIVIVWFVKTKDARKVIAFAKKMEDATNRGDSQAIIELYEEFYFVDLSSKEIHRYLPVFMAAMVDKGMYTPAMEIGTKVLQNMPKHQQAHTLMARCFFYQGKLPEFALKHFIAMFDAETPEKEIVEFAGTRIMKQNMASKECIPILRAFNQCFPEHEECRELLLSLLAGQRNIDNQYRDLLIQHVEKNPTEIKNRLKLAEYYLNRRQFEECLEYCEQVINLNITDKKLHEIMIEAYRLQGTPGDLEPLYDDLLQTYPNSIVVQEAHALVKRLIRGEES